MSLNYAAINTFIFDMDGTLLNGQHVLSENTVTTLQCLRERNANLIIATGRHLRDIQCYIAQLGGGIASITCNGANIHSATGQLVASKELPLSANQALLSLGANFNVHTNLYTHNEWMVCTPCEQLLLAHTKSQFFYRMTNLAEMLKAPALKILFYGEHSELLALKAQIDPALSANLNVTFSDPNYLEIMQKNISKGDALKVLLNEMNLPLDQTMAFGDSMNDVELFRTAAHPIIMANASPELFTLFPSAQRTVTNDQDGVAKYLQQHFL